MKTILQSYTVELIGGYQRQASSEDLDEKPAEAGSRREL